MDKVNEPRFSSEIRNLLASNFSDAYLKANPNATKSAGDYEAEIYVRGLEGLVEVTAEAKPRTPEKEQRRKERIEAFANALDRLIDTALDMDDPALGFAIWRGLAEAVKHDTSLDIGATPEEVEKMKGLKSTLLAYELQTMHARDLQQFALGVRRAIKELPPKEEPSFSEMTAKWIEDYLGRIEIPFSTSDTGLAGASFLAVMELAGIPMDRATYWLGKAAKNPDSWQHFIERMKDKYQA